MVIQELIASSKQVVARHGTLTEVNSANVRARFAGFRVPWFKFGLLSESAIDVAQGISIVDERRTFPRSSIEGRVLRKGSDVWARSTRSPFGKWYTGMDWGSDGIDWDKAVQLGSEQPYEEDHFEMKTTVHRFDFALSVDAAEEMDILPPIFTMSPMSGKVAYRVDNEGLICSMSSTVSVSIGLARSHQSLKRQEVLDRIDEWSDAFGRSIDHELVHVAGAEQRFLGELVLEVFSGRGSMGLDFTFLKQVKDLGKPIEEVVFPLPEQCIASIDPKTDAFRPPHSERDTGLGL